MADLVGSTPRVVATDLDGTLLRSDGTISRRTRQALDSAWAAGIVTVFVTARPPRWLDELSDVVGEHGIVVCGNGAFVYDVPQRQVVTQRAFDPGELLTLVRDLRSAVPGIGFAAERADGLGREVGFVDPHHEEYVLMDHAGATSHPVGKLLATSTEVEAPEFHLLMSEAVAGRAELGFSGVMGLAEMTAPGVTKASGLAAWCKERGFGADQVWACGDMPNDLPMLRWAGRALAVANAHTDVLAIADEVLVSNDDDAVATVLERLL